MCSTLPAEKMPGIEVWYVWSTSAPFEPRSMTMPAARASSFSGMRPTESSTVSHGMISSVPGIAFFVALSTCETPTASTRLRPYTFVMVCRSRSGMP